MHANLSGGLVLPEPSHAQRKPALRSKGSFCGHFIYGDDPGRVIVFESDLERKVALIFAADPAVVAIDEQAACCWHDRDGTERTHFFDFLVHFKDGRRVAVAVKHSKRLVSGRVIDELNQIAEQVCGKFADEVRVVTEGDINPIQLHNAELFNAVRHTDVRADTAALEAVRGLRGQVLIADLVRKIDMGPMGFRSIVRMIAKGQLQLSEHRAIAPSARVIAIPFE